MSTHTHTSKQTDTHHHLLAVASLLGSLVRVYTGHRIAVQVGRPWHAKGTFGMCKPPHSQHCKKPIPSPHCINYLLHPQNFHTEQGPNDHEVLHPKMTILIITLNCKMPKDCHFGGVKWISCTSNQSQDPRSLVHEIRQVVFEGMGSYIAGRNALCCNTYSMVLHGPLYPESLSPTFSAHTKCLDILLSIT